jgi:hypothetical protein
MEDDFTVCASILTHVFAGAVVFATATTLQAQIAKSTSTIVSVTVRHTKWWGPRLTATVTVVANFKTVGPAHIIKAASPWTLCGRVARVVRLPVVSTPFAKYAAPVKLLFSEPAAVAACTKVVAELIGGDWVPRRVAFGSYFIRVASHVCIYVQFTQFGAVIAPTTGAMHATRCVFAQLPAHEYKTHGRLLALADVSKLTACVCSLAT